jgi:hypothetical protein
MNLNFQAHALLNLIPMAVFLGEYYNSYLVDEKNKANFKKYRVVCSV